MAMITWWTECQGEKGCGHVSYTRNRLHECEKCGCTDVQTIRENDEPELDYPSRGSLYEEEE